jgi:hypothetical protein
LEEIVNQQEKTIVRIWYNMEDLADLEIGRQMGPFFFYGKTGKL